MKIYNYIEELRQFYDSKTIETPGDSEYSQSQLITYINCTRASRYLDDNATDDIIGDYPYDNVSKYRVRLEARAIDPDTKMVDIEPKNGSRISRVSAMVANKALAKHMRDIKLGNTFNRIADVHTEYGGVLPKKVGENVEVENWENVITDMTDIMGGLIVSRHYYTPAQLKKQGWQNVDDIIRTATTRSKEDDMDKDGKKNKTVTHLIEVWEVHGEITKAAYEEALAEFEGRDYEENEDDEVEFVEAQIIFAPEGKDDEGEMQGTLLQVNEEKLEDVYKYKARNYVSGRGLGEGVPEELKEHQRWHNFFKTEEVRAVAIAGKVVFVTNDGQVMIDSIFDEGIDHGAILKISNTTGNEFFQQLNTLPSSIPLYHAMDDRWNDSGDKLTNSFAAALGDQEFGNVPFKAQYLQDLNSNGQFKQTHEELMEELIKPIIEDWVLPDALAKAASEDEIYETFSKAELQLIDDVIIAKELPKRMAKILLEEKRSISPEEAETMKIGMQAELDGLGAKRNIKGIKDFIKKDVIGNVVIHTSDETRNKQTMFESYANALNLFAENDPARMAIRDRILDQMGVTPEELSLYAQEAMAVAQSLAPANPQLDAGALAEETPKEALV